MLATLMVSITVLTYGLFAHALTAADSGPATPVVTPHSTTRAAGA